MDCNNNCSNNVVQTNMKPKFGIMFDIDGVLLRGKSPVPNAAKALELLMDPTLREFQVPCVFCTNGFGLREVKAATLSERLGIHVNPDQLVMSQTPLEMFHEFHDKWCLVSGPEHDGGSVQVAESLGFNKIITIDQLREAHPYLDWVDRRRWPDNPVEVDKTFPAIEAIVLLGEPIRWETNLQLIIDVLVTNGKPDQHPMCDPTLPQLPVLAVNMDLQWMAKANIPRFGHGAFLVCLENLYKKICGRELEYTALIGKPSEITYEYSQKLIEEIATTMNIPGLDTVYAIGDNPLTDIYGANMFNLFLEKKRREIVKQKKEYLSNSRTNSPKLRRSIEGNTEGSEFNATNSHLAHIGDITNVRGIQKCTSLLVCTGVYKPSASDNSAAACGELNPSISLAPSKTCDVAGCAVDHGHRDLPYTEHMTKADHIVHDVKNAIDKIFDIEGYIPNCAK